MKETSFASLKYAAKKRKTRREKFLGEMRQVVTWLALVALIEAYYRAMGAWQMPSTKAEPCASSWASNWRASRSPTPRRC